MKSEMLQNILKSEKIQKLLKNHYFLTAMMCFVAWIVHTLPMENAFSKDKGMFSLALLFSFALFAVYFVWKYRDIENKGEMITLLILIGVFVVRLIYIWSTPYTVSPHDVNYVPDKPDVQWGHLGYTGYIYHNWQLPDMNPVTVFGYYNPPFQYLVCAVWLKINTAIGVDWSLAIENLQFIPLLMTMWTTVGMDRLLKEFDLKGKCRHIFLAFFTFFPPLIHFSGQLSTDAMVLFWMIHILLFTIRWYKNRDYKTIILLALCIGLGMMTKVSVGVLAFGVAAVFIWVLIDAIRRDRASVSKYIGQFALFGFICLPLGLYWSLRCYFMFDVPFAFVPDPQALEMKFADKPFWEVWGIPSVRQMAHTEINYDNTVNDYNVWATMLRSALFDEAGIVEFTSEASDFAARIFMYLNIPLVFFMNGCYIVVMFGRKYKIKLALKVFTGVVYLSMLVSYISFVAKFPYVCSTNFRYVAVVFALPVIGTAYFFRDRTKTKLFKIFCLYAAVTLSLGLILYLRYCFTI